MTKRKGSLLRQLTVSVGLAIIFLSLASFYYQYQVERYILVGNIRASLVSQATLLRAWLAEADTRTDRETTAQQYIETLEHVNKSKSKQDIIVVDEKSKILAANTGQKPGQDYGSAILADVMAPGAPRDGITAEIAGEFVHALPCYADAAGKQLVGAILIKQPLVAVDRLADSLMLGAFILLAVTLVILVIVVHVVLRFKVHKPMQAIFMQEYRIREGDLAKIEAEDPANEFSDLYAMYNEMVMRIADQKRAILEQKDHVALAHLVRQAITRLTGPLDDILSQSRTLIEHQSSLSDADRATLKKIIADVTRIAKELRAIVVEGDRSASWLRRETDKVREYDEKPAPDEKSGE